MKSATRVVVVTNPHAGTQATEAVGPVSGALRAAGHDIILVHTRRDASEAAAVREAIDDGARQVVAIGGDGTVHRVVNAMVDAETGQPHAPGLQLGLIAAGTGSDFTRTFGLHLPVRRAVTHLTGGGRMPIDLGRIHCVDDNGDPVTRLFANIADIGWAADVVQRAARLPRHTGRARYALAVIGAARAMQPRPVHVALDHTTRDDDICQVLVANGQFFGSGFRVAPRALPDDGTFNVQTWGTGPGDILRQLPNVRVGEHMDHPAVREWQSRRVHIAPTGTSMRVEADGEPIGHTPATIDIVSTPLSLML